MPLSLIIILLFVAAVTVICCWTVTVWWRAMIRNPRWVIVFPAAVPLIIFGPLFAIGSAATQLGIGRKTQFISAVLCLLAVAVVSFRGAWKYHHIRRDRARPNV
jgi:hypothetical protein